MKRNGYTFRTVMTILSIAFVCFIWGNSLVPGKESGALSLSIRDFVNNILRNIGINAEVTNYMVRKAAHFTEHMFFGACLLVTLRSYTKDIIRYLSNILFIGLLVPVIDEFIQLFIDGRGGEIKDVIIDFSGILTGIIIASIIVRLVDRNRMRNKNKERKIVGARYKNYKR